MENAIGSSGPLRWVLCLATLRAALAHCRGERLMVIKTHYLQNPGENTPESKVDEAFSYFAKAHRKGAK